MLIQSLKVFCDLIDTQSFSKTATLNSVTQSAVSQQLKAIENRQGKQLVEREKRRLNLTAEGEIFYHYAKEIIRRYDEMQHQIEALDGIVSGTVHLSTIYSIGLLELGRYIKTYLKSFPSVNLRLDYNLAEQIYDDVASSEVDLGIVAYPRPRRMVEVIPFIQDQLVVICHPQHPLSEKPAVRLKDLDGLPFIAFTEEAPTRQALDQLFRKSRATPVFVMEQDHIATIKNAVEVDLGVSVVPEHAVEQEKIRGTLKIIQLEGGSLYRPLGILYKKGRSLSPASEKLIEILTQEPPAQSANHNGQQKQSPSRKQRA